MSATNAVIFTIYIQVLAIAAFVLGRTAMTSFDFGYLHLATLTLLPVAGVFCGWVARGQTRHI